jgi:carboxylesterase 2/para-nitrobenzyl esterase
VNSAATAQRIGRRLAEDLGVAATREAIAAIPPERILQAQAKLRSDLLARPDPAFWGEVASSCLPWAPTVDGATIPAAPIERIREGIAADIDLLVGSNTEETRLFLLSDGSMDRITEEALAGMARAYGLPAEGLSGYRAAHPGASAGDLFSAIQTDWYWRVPTVRMADAHAKTARCHVYVRVRLALATDARPPRRGAWRRNALCVRYAGSWNGAAPWAIPTAVARRHDARGLDRLRRLR